MNYTTLQVNTVTKTVTEQGNIIKSEENKISIGRYCFDIPEHIKRFRDFHKIGDTILQEEPFISPFEKAYEHAWQTRIEKIEALKKKRNGIKDLRGKIIEKLLITSEINGVLFYGNENNHILTLNAFQNAGSVGLWLQMDGEYDMIRQLEEHIRKIAASYRFSEETEDLFVPGKDLFYLTHGAIACTPLHTEESSAYFCDERNNIELDINTKIVTTPLPGLFDRFELTMMNPVAWKNGGITFLKKRVHKVNSFKGEEIFCHDTNKNRLSFLWSCTGEPKSGRYPEITVSMHVPDNDLSKMTCLWEKIISSIRSANSVKNCKIANV